MKNKVFNSNPICPYTRNDCNNQDMNGYTDCSNCPGYGNEVRATGATPILGSVIEFFKSLNHAVKK